MPTISNTPRPGYVFDVTDNVWYPIGTGSHNHSEIASTIVDAKGDIIAATAADTPARLAVGADNTILTADSTQATGIKWATPASSIPANDGATVATSQTTTSATYTDLTTAGPAVTVTTSTKVLVIISAQLEAYGFESTYMSFAVSGATTSAATDARSIYSIGTSSDEMSLSAAQVITVTAGSNTFTAKYKCTGGSARSFENRHIFVMNLA